MDLTVQTTGALRETQYKAQKEVLDSFTSLLPRSELVPVTRMSPSVRRDSKMCLTS